MKKIEDAKRIIDSSTELKLSKERDIFMTRFDEIDTQLGKIKNYFLRNIQNSKILFSTAICPFKLNNGSELYFIYDVSGRPEMVHKFSMISYTFEMGSFIHAMLTHMHKCSFEKFMLILGLPNIFGIDLNVKNEDLKIYNHPDIYVNYWPVFRIIMLAKETMLYYRYASEIAIESGSSTTLDRYYIKIFKNIHGGHHIIESPARAVYKKIAYFLFNNILCDKIIETIKKMYEKLERVGDEDRTG
jgi:hypothetical protein